MNRCGFVWLWTETLKCEGEAALRDFLTGHLKGGRRLTNDLNKIMQLKQSQLLSQTMHGQCTVGNIAWLSSNEASSYKDKKH